jgi:hypothetical protein
MISSGEHAIVALVDEARIDAAKERLAEAAAGRPTPADMDAALERARTQVQALAAAAATLESSIPDAVRETLRAEAAPMSRRVNELRGLANATIKRLERLEEALTAERYARVDDLQLLVDLIASSGRSVDERLTQIEAAIRREPGGATIHKIA